MVLWHILVERFPGFMPMRSHDWKNMEQQEERGRFMKLKASVEDEAELGKMEEEEEIEVVETGTTTTTTTAVDAIEQVEEHTHQPQ
jgi:hypothetical protein